MSKNITIKQAAILKYASKHTINKWIIDGKIDGKCKNHVVVNQKFASIQKKTGQKSEWGKNFRVGYKKNDGK